MILYGLGIAFTIWMAVECVRRGQTNPWIWIILFFPTVGAAVYFFSEYLGQGGLPRWRGSGRASKRELNHAQAEVRRLDNSESWAHYAQMLRSRRSFVQAQAAAEKAVEKDPSNRHALYELGLAQIGSERYADATKTLSRLVAGHPNHDSGEARYALAVAYEKCGNKDDALGTLEELARTTSLPKVLFSLATLQAEAGHTGEARQSLERIIDEAEYVPSYHRREVRPWVRKARRALASLPS